MKRSILPSLCKQIGFWFGSFNTVLKANQSALDKIVVTITSFVT